VAGRSLTNLLWPPLAALALLSACADPVDRAAKARIFSPEDPPKVIASASEPLAVERLAGDAASAQRVVRMGAAEATERLGPHRLKAQVAFEFSGGAAAVKLSETRTFAAGKGGVAGDFHAVLENSRNQGLEVIRSGGEVYARRRFGKFRHRKRDRGMAERVREEVYGAVRDADALVHGRLLLTAAGHGSHLGRAVHKFQVSLGPAQLAENPAVTLPPLPSSKAGPDNATRLRQQFASERQPKGLSGELWVDGQTGVVLKADLEATVGAPGASEEEVLLKLTVHSLVEEVGSSATVAAPEEFLPDADKPYGIVDALDRFGMPRAGKGDAGTLAEEEPADEL
jgi:hypothetical protein